MSELDSVQGFENNGANNTAEGVSKEYVFQKEGINYTEVENSYRPKHRNELEAYRFYDSGVKRKIADLEKLYNISFTEHVLMNAKEGFFEYAADSDNYIRLVYQNKNRKNNPDPSFIERCFNGYSDRIIPSDYCLCDLENDPAFVNTFKTLKDFKYTSIRQCNELTLKGQLGGKCAELGDFHEAFLKILDKLKTRLVYRSSEPDEGIYRFVINGIYLITLDLQEKLYHIGCLVCKGAYNYPL